MKTATQLKAAASKSVTPNDQKTEQEPKKKRRRGWLGITAGLIVGFAGVVATRLGYLWPAFDVLSHFTLHFVFLIVASALGGMIPRFKSLAAVVILIMMVVAYGLWPQWSSSNASAATAPQAGEKALKIASFNTKAKNTSIDAIVKTIRDLDPDIMVMVEFKPDKSPVIEQLKETYPFNFVCTPNDRCEGAILSKVPLLSTSLRGEWEGPPFVQAVLGSEYGNLTVIGVHTQRFPNTRKQFVQAGALIRLIETVPGNVVLMGDFNATPFSRVLSVIEQGSGLVRQTYLPSWPAQLGLPQLAIDHILISKGVKALSPPQMGEAAGSDHLPVAMTIAVPSLP